MTTITAISDFVTKDMESGVGLAIQDDKGRYLFFLAGTRHRCSPGEIFYAGIGGHREPDEDWITCAHREAAEEIHASIAICSAPQTFYISRAETIERVDVSDQPRPLVLYEMVHPPGSSREGEIYRIVIFSARLQTSPRDFPVDEAGSVIFLTSDQVARGLERKPTLATLRDEGAEVILGSTEVSWNIRLYPIGTAKALALILSHIAVEDLQASS